MATIAGHNAWHSDSISSWDKNRGATDATIFSTASGGHLSPSDDGSRSENEMSKVTYLNEGKVSKTFKRKRWKHKRTQ
jgi:hypothetical protein